MAVFVALLVGLEKPLTEVELFYHKINLLATCYTDLWTKKRTSTEV